MMWTPRMAEAAKILGLDPDDERIRKLFVDFMRRATGKVGRPKYSGRNGRDLERLGRIAEGYYKYEMDDGHVCRTGPSDRRLAKIIHDTMPEFRTVTVDAIRVLLPAARDAYDWYRDEAMADAMADMEPPEGWADPHDDDGN